MQRVGDGNDQDGGVGDMGLDQHFRLCCVARHGGNARVAQRLHQLPVLLGHDAGNAGRSQCLGNAPAHLAVAHQHHLPFQILAFGAHGQLGKGVVAPFQLAGQF